LRVRQVLDLAEHGSQELVDRGPRQLGFRLDAAGRENVHIGCTVPRVLE
jgi:hypothetical protein